MNVWEQQTEQSHILGHQQPETVYCWQASNESELHMYTEFAKALHGLRGDVITVCCGKRSFDRETVN